MAELVSICMLAYNHEKWIGKAIQSIMDQITEYSFKLYIHEDVSTDKTRDIVLKYASEYPDKIELVLADENRYSKGIRIIPEILAPMTKGKYICLCEGDDFWLDPCKLQKQISYMEENPKCSLSFSNARVVDPEDNELTIFLPQYTWNDRTILKKLRSNEEVDFDLEEIILLDFIPTASLVYKREIYDDIRQFSKSLDLLNRLVATSYGYAHYHPECFVAYRTGNPNSASGSIQKSKDKIRRDFYDLHCSILDEFDDFTNKKYHKLIEVEKQRKRLIYELKIGQLLRVVSNRSFITLNKKYFLKNAVNVYFSNFYNVLRRRKYKSK